MEPFLAQFFLDFSFFFFPSGATGGAVDGSVFEAAGFLDMLSGFELS